MARYTTSIASRLAPAAAFAYLADFTHAHTWDPSVSVAERAGDGPLALGSEFELVSRFGGRDVRLRYAIVGFEPPQLVVLEARRPTFVSRDTITVEPTAQGCTVDYNAELTFRGLAALFDPVFQRLFTRVGDRAAAGLATALNP